MLKVNVLVAQSYPTLCDLTDVAQQAPLSMDFSRQDTGRSCHFLLQGSSWPKDQTWASRIVGKFFTIWAIKEAPTILKWVSPSPGSFPSLGIEPWSPTFHEDSLPKWNYKAALNNTWVKRPVKISQHLRIMFVKTNYPIDRVNQKLLAEIYG